MLNFNSTDIGNLIEAVATAINDEEWNTQGLAGTALRDRRYYAPAIVATMQVLAWLEEIDHDWKRNELLGLYNIIRERAAEIPDVIKKTRQQEARREAVREGTR
jgi:hypothetical protein